MSGSADFDLICMARALELARRGWGRTHPNPMVGAVIAKGGEMVAEGWHRAAGEPHAEIEALAACGQPPGSDATLYVTLEPCSTTGRTGPCTDAIIESGIRRVVVGAVDPNPAHAGRGLDLLRQAGIEVESGLLDDLCQDLNLVFNHWIRHRRPLLAVKMALTLDGRFAAPGGHSRWVTGELARADVMHWRRLFPAIAVGAGTVLADDPRLTARDEDGESCGRRFVIDSGLRTAATTELPQLYSDSFAGQTTVVCSSAADGELAARLERRGVGLWRLPPTDDGRVPLAGWLRRCADEGLVGIYVEPGPALAAALFEQEQVDYAFVYTAAKLIADSGAPGLGGARGVRTMDEAVRLEQVRHTVLGADVLTRGRIARAGEGPDRSGKD